MQNSLLTLHPKQTHNFRLKG